MSRRNSELKIGLSGLDSSHCVEHAALLHQADQAHHVAAIRQVEVLIAAQCVVVEF